jgi:hypothetical protein
MLAHVVPYGSSFGATSFGSTSVALHTVPAPASSGAASIDDASTDESIAASFGADASVGVPSTGGS